MCGFDFFYQQPTPTCPHCGYAMTDDDMVIEPEHDLVELAINGDKTTIWCLSCGQQYALQGGYYPRYTSDFCAEDQQVEIGSEDKASEIASEVWANSRQSGSRMLMLLAIASFVDKSGMACVPMKALAERCRMTVRNARMVVAFLKEARELEVLPGEPNGCNVFRILNQGEG